MRSERKGLVAYKLATLLHTNMNTTKNKATPQTLLKDLREIKAVLDVESKLIRALVKMAVARQTMGVRLAF